MRTLEEIVEDAGHAAYDGDAAAAERLSREAHARGYWKGVEKFQAAEAEVARLRAEVEERERALPDDLRAEGWSVAVHNDYRLGGEAHTFWLFTKASRAVKGEGRTDAEALNAVRAALRPHNTTTGGGR